MSLLHRSELADGEEVDPAQQSETPLHQLLSLRDTLRGVVITQLGQRLSRFHPEALTEHPLGIRDPALDVAA